jgi:FkbM family methyltransferase
VKSLFKRLAARLPQSWQEELKRHHFRRQIKRNRFHTAEPEFGLLPELVMPGDLVLDIGANIGHYTKRMSDLAGPRGRVIAFEPVPDTFAVLCANVQAFRHRNVTLVNAAVSRECGLVRMAIPRFGSGLKNYYQARIVATADADDAVSAVTVSIDSLTLQKVALVKVDVEEHEEQALEGMAALLARDHPALIIETDSTTVHDTLVGMGYSPDRLPGSPNLLCR